MRTRRLSAATARLALVGVGLLALTACTDRAPRDPRPLVVTSVAPQGWLVEQLAGELVRIEVLVPPGANPHAFEPSLRQLRALSEAAVYLKVGHPAFSFERAWLDGLLAESPSLRVVDGSRGLQGLQNDPHVWLSPAQVARTARDLSVALAEILPGQRAELASRRDGLLAELGELESELATLLAPHAGQRFFVFHPAWGYFAEAQGLVQVAIERDGREPDPRSLARLIDDARAAGLQVIFAEPQFDRSAALTVAEAIGARVELLDPLGVPWDENLLRSARRIAAGCVP